MRLTAYKKCIDQAFDENLPEIFELELYFGDAKTNPRDAYAIMAKARQDTGSLYLSELNELYKYYLERKEGG